jgi:hypothetical protein
MLGRWVTAGLVIVALLCAGAALAEDPSRVRLSDALDATDRRIELASGLLAEAASVSSVAQGELTIARDLQSRARSAYVANQAAIALRETMDARAHADRVIALVRGLPDPDRVQGQVEHTRDIIDRARERLQACEDLRARAMLRVALDMQERAEGRLGESMYLGALQLTMSARERVRKAMQLCRVDESMGDAVDRALQRTTDVLSRAQESLDADTPPASRDALSRAHSIQAQAQAEARLEHYESALRLTQGARALVQRVLRPGRGPRGRTR